MRTVLLIICCAAAAACRVDPPGTSDRGAAKGPDTSAATPAEVVVWKEVGAWSGRGNAQTESFTSDTGGFRVRWETKNETRPGAGRLKVIFRSGDSGRPIIDAVDARGVGKDEEIVADNVRWYFLTIESAGVDWTVHVDERLRGRATK